MNRGAMEKIFTQGFMWTKKHCSRAILIVLSLSLLGAGCSSSSDSGSEETSDGSTLSAEADSTSATITFAYQADISSFDPDNGFEVAGLGAINSVYEGLVEYAPNSTELGGLLAESWTISDDGLIYTFKIRDGVNFHDGTPMTAQEAKISLERRWKDTSLALNYFLYNVVAIDAPDAKTLVINLKDPQISFLDNLASPWGPKIISPAALTANSGSDNAKTFLNEQAVGTGPFALTSFSRGDRYILDRFDDYWGETAKAKQIIIKIVPEISQQVLQLSSGEIDAVLHGYPVEQLNAIAEGLEVSSYNDLGLELAYINPNGVLNTKELRQNVIAAINPETWVEETFGQYATLPASLFPVSMIPVSSAMTWPVKNASVKVPAIQIWYATEEASTQKRVADVMTSKLAADGIDATSRAVPASQIQSIPQNPKGAPDIVIAQNYPDSAHPDSQAYLFYSSGGPLNLFKYLNPAVDELIFAASAISNREERDKVYLDISAKIFEDGTFVPLANIKALIVHRSLKNLNPRPAVPWTVDFGTVQK